MCLTDIIFHFSNQLVPCSAIPEVDLSYWKDHSYGGFDAPTDQSYNLQYFK